MEPLHSHAMLHPACQPAWPLKPGGNRCARNHTGFCLVRLLGGAEPCPSTTKFLSDKVLNARPSHSYFRTSAFPRQVVAAQEGTPYATCAQQIAAWSADSLAYPAAATVAAANQRRGMPRVSEFTEVS